MAQQRQRVGEAAASALAGGIAQIQREQKVAVDFSEAALKEAKEAAASPQLPDLDRTDLPFLTIDPPGSMDLDQAMHIERSAAGFVVYYAIADLTAFVTPGGALDRELRDRGESLYGGGAHVPLHPVELSEGAASLLPDQTRPAFLWTLTLDQNGVLKDTRIERARVRSRQRLDYPGVQKSIDEGTPDPTVALLREVGELRIKQEEARGGVALRLPDQEIDVNGSDWSLTYRATRPVEEWNAQISLLTGFAAAGLMTKAKVGLLRTLPEAAPEAITRLRQTAAALKVAWPESQGYADFLRSLDPEQPPHVALLVAATSLLRGAAYTAFNGEVPEHPEQAALASTYAHVTAPLRRLGDRYALAICAALCAGEPVPAWVLQALDEIPEAMLAADRRSHAYERAVLNLVEAQVLASAVGDEFEGVVLSAEKDGSAGQLMVREPAVEARIEGAVLPVGSLVTATLAEASPATRTVRFALIAPSS